MSRSPRPEDLFALRVPTDLRVSPDGRFAVFAVKSVAPRKDGYRSALWVAPADGSCPARQLTLGAKTDGNPRWSPDGRTLAFLSDRGAILQAGGAGERPGPAELPEDGATQAWLLPVDGGEARQLTRLPHDVTDLTWSPDGTRLCVSSPSLTTRIPPKPGPDRPPERDTRFIDRLAYQLNGVGFTYDRPNNLWLVDVAGERVERITGGQSNDENPVWSPDGGLIAFVSNRHRDADLTWRTDIYVVDPDGGRPIRVTGGQGDQIFTAPAWSPDSRWIATIGHRYPAGGGSRPDVWRFHPTERDEGEDLTADSDLMVGAAMLSDLFAMGDARLQWTDDGRWIVFAAPVDGSYELWRVDVAEKRVERITNGRHHIFRQDLASSNGSGARLIAARATSTTSADIVSIEVPAEPLGEREPAIRSLSDLMGGAWGDVDVVRPVVRWHEVDGRRIQGWFFAARANGNRPAPLVVEIHGGPATLYGETMFWEWQCLLAAGISVYACNPRGSQGYGQDFCRANFRDWGDGPMRDVLAGVDSLIADGLVDPDRLGVTGGSYGGYLTTWIVGHTDRFRAAVTCRSVADLTSQMLTGDISGPQFGKFEYGSNPWEEPQIYFEHSPLTYATRIRTPLLIQHAERDLRCPVTQAEELFTVLRSLRRPVRLMRVPEENHELTRGGAPVRRVENLAIIRDWFRHFLVEGKTRLPPVPRTKSAVFDESRAASRPRSRTRRGRAPHTMAQPAPPMRAQR
jgi:dipeptidyl aminopeptidase/acylaminoacyl peptidase